MEHSSILMGEQELTISLALSMSCDKSAKATEMSLPASSVFAARVLSIPDEINRENMLYRELAQSRIEENSSIVDWLSRASIQSREDSMILAANYQ